MKLAGKEKTRVETNLGQVLRVAGQVLVVSALLLDQVATRKARRPQSQDA